MEEDILNLKEKFNQIKKKGWIKSVRKKSTGVGTTLEQALNIKENRNELPDFNGIEIKTKGWYKKRTLYKSSLIQNGRENRI